MSGKERIAKRGQVADDGWTRAKPQFGEGLGARVSAGIVGLATDRIGVWDFESFLRPLSGVAVFSTRIPMSPVATPKSLKALGKHIGKGAEMLVPGSRLDVVAFSCTSGTVAVGLDNVRKAIQAVRPGVHVTTPIEAGAKGLRRLGARRISLLTPYLPATADLIAGYFENHGFDVLSRSTFDLNGDPEMNRLSGPALVRAARAILDPRAEALFLSCTGLRTSGVVQKIEDALGVPVVTSNQALAWDSLRVAGDTRKVSGEGRLFRL